MGSAGDGERQVEGVVRAAQPLPVSTLFTTPDAAHICQRCSLMRDLMHCENTAKIQRSTWLRITWRYYNKAIEKPIIISREQDTEVYIVSRHSHRSGYKFDTEDMGNTLLYKNISGGDIKYSKTAQNVVTRHAKKRSLHSRPISEGWLEVEAESLLFVPRLAFCNSLGKSEC